VWTLEKGGQRGGTDTDDSQIDQGKGKGREKRCSNGGVLGKEDEGTQKQTRMEGYPGQLIFVLETVLDLPKGEKGGCPGSNDLKTKEDRKTQGRPAEKEPCPW